MRVRLGLGALLAVVLAVAAPAFAQGSAPAEGKPGGVLRLVLREDLPQGFAIHESATNSVTWPAMPCYSNLVIFDQLKRVGRLDTIAPELAERWSWQDNYRNLVFFLRRDVRWHDGQPFTSKDVKFTFDLVREAKDAPTRLRLNPRKEWYSNVEAVEAPDPYTVVFRLKRPQPSLIAILASGYSPVIPAHVPLAEHRSRCVGTGPFKFKEWKRGQSVDLVRNPDYFMKGRPYLDGLRYIVIVERGTRVAALQTNQVDVAYPGDTTVSIAEQLRGAVPQMSFTETATNVSENLLLNTKRPPFDNVKVRRALSLAIDRRAYVKAVHSGSALVGAAMAPKPWGAWGLPEKDTQQLPGYGKGEEGKVRARKLLAEAGFGPGYPLKVEMATRAIAIYLDFASFVISELKQAGCGSHAQADRHRAVASPGHPPGIPGGGQSHRPRGGRSRRQLLRELRVRLFPELRRLLQRGGDAPHRPAVAGDRCPEAPDPRVADPEEARGGRRAPCHGLARGSFRPLSQREEPHPQPGHL